jgi:hypothetical protein
MRTTVPSKRHAIAVGAWQPAAAPLRHQELRVPFTKGIRRRNLHQVEAPVTACATAPAVSLGKLGLPTLTRQSLLPDYHAGRRR